MLLNTVNMALQISRIFYTFVLRAEICTTFEPKVVRTSARNRKVYETWGAIFSYIFPLFKTRNFPRLRLSQSDTSIFLQKLNFKKTLIYFGQC